MLSYTELFMIKAATFFKNFFPVFILSAVFGKIMEENGMAKSIALVCGITGLKVLMVMIALIFVSVFGIA